MGREYYQEYLIYLEHQKTKFNLSDGWYQLSMISDFSYDMFQKKFEEDVTLREKLKRDLRNKKINQIVG